MYTCADCTLHSCVKNDHTKMPKNCPMRKEAFMAGVLEKYAEPENNGFYVTCSYVEKEGYCRWPRLKETVEFCRKMGYKKVGLAFCEGLSAESRIVAKLLRDAGFQVVSVMCKTGGIPKEKAGIPQEKKICPEEFEPMCNPIAQAMLLNEQQTEFNVMMGLCVGHDSMFYKYSQAMVTTLVAKDRVLAHNPAGAIYCSESYFQEMLNYKK